MTEGIFIFWDHSCVASFRLSGSARNDLPHSKQDRFAREVINPQNGHILCDPVF